MRRIAICLVSLLCFAAACSKPAPHLTIGSKFFTEQVILAELLAQHIEARTHIHVSAKPISAALF